MYTHIYIHIYTYIYIWRTQPDTQGSGAVANTRGRLLDKKSASNGDSALALGDFVGASARVRLVLNVF